jgi:hypothetical protein
MPGYGNFDVKSSKENGYWGSSNAAGNVSKRLTIFTIDSKWCCYGASGS